MTLTRVLIILFIIPAFFAIESQTVHFYFNNGQLTANIIMVVCFCLVFASASSLLRGLLGIMVLVSIPFEIVGSIFLVMYSYRYGNIPLYVPFGHAIVYACAYVLAECSVSYKQETRITLWLLGIVSCISITSFLVLHDTFGMMCFLVLLVCIKKPGNRLFYLWMFLVVYYLECIGTYFGAWTWYGILGNHRDWVSTANPPAGIAGLYAFLDLTVNFFSKKILKLKPIYKNK